MSLLSPLLLLASVSHTVSLCLTTVVSSCLSLRRYLFCYSISFASSPPISLYLYHSIISSLLYVSHNLTLLLFAPLYLWWGVWWDLLMGEGDALLIGGEKNGRKASCEGVSSSI